MPRMDKNDSTNALIGLLLIGDGRIGKTQLAAEAARHFNLVYLNGDGNTLSTLNKMPDEIKRNIYAINVGDTVTGGVRDCKFIETMQEFTGNMKFRWDDTNQKVATRNSTGEIWEIKPGQLDHTYVLVVDSWTALCESMMLQAARANGVDLATATTNQMRPVYQSSGLKATAILQCIKALKCHVIVLAHPDEYEHKTAPEGRTVNDIKEKDMVVDWTKLIPKSVSKPHGFGIGRFFTDVGWMEVSPSGLERRVNFKMKNDRIVGGHFTDCKSTELYSFANLVREIGGHVPDSPTGLDDAFVIIEEGAEKPEPKSNVLDASETKGIKGITGLGR